jgi:hypothetical protein
MELSVNPVCNDIAVLGVYADKQYEKLAWAVPGEKVAAPEAFVDAFFQVRGGLIQLFTQGKRHSVNVG